MLLWEFNFLLAIEIRRTKNSRSHPTLCIHWHKIPGGYNIVNNIAVPRSLLCWAFYKFRTNNSCKEFITPESVVSMRADQQPNAIKNDNCTGFSDLDISNWNHNFIIFIKIILKYRFYVPPSQLVSSFHFSVHYLSSYLITFRYLKTEIHWWCYKLLGL